MLVLAFLVVGIFATVSQIDKTQDTGSDAAGVGKGRKAAASISVSPNPALINSPFTISGSGFPANKIVYVGLQGYFDLKPVTADSTGKFSLSHSAISIPGTYTTVALIEARKGNWETIASASFLVQ
ncbi:MAG: hypothetical protein Q8Q15_02530 [bacterium]|nr:hypothetical protein [bacterium]